jgi:hypothetical protein
MSICIIVKQSMDSSTVMIRLTLTRIAHGASFFYGGFLLRLRRLGSMSLFQLSLSLTVMFLQTLCRNIILKNFKKIIS